MPSKWTLGKVDKMKVIVSNAFHRKQISLVLRNFPSISEAQAERAKASLCPTGSDCQCGGGVLNQAGPESIKDLEGVLYDAAEKSGKISLKRLNP